MARVWKHSKQELGTLLVELALADFANDDGECWAKNETLAKKARLQDRMVRYAIRKLIDDGEIEKIASPSGKRNCNTYHFLIEDRQSDATGKICHRQSSATQGGNPVPPASSIYEPSVEPSLQPAAVAGLPPCPAQTKPPAFCPCFDMLVRIFGFDPIESRRAPARVKGLLKKIREYTPEVTPGEIQRRYDKLLNDNKDWKKSMFTPDVFVKRWPQLSEASQITFINDNGRV